MDQIAGSTAHRGAGPLRENAWTRFVGPLTPTQSAAVLGAALGAGAAVGTTTARRVGPVRGALVGAVAVDLVGGLVTFQLRPTRDRYARTPTRLTFVLTHLQPFVLPLVGQGTWKRAAARYIAVVAASGALEVLPLRPAVRRGVANAIGAVAGALDWVTDRPGQDWFGPVYLMKVIGGHGGVPHGPVTAATSPGATPRTVSGRAPDAHRSAPPVP